MSREIKISRAFCVELGKNVDIDEIHHESIKDGTPHKRFNFLCTDPICQENGVRIVGVAYDKLPSQRKVLPYFRRDREGQSNHHPECEWFRDGLYYNFDGLHEGETEQQARIRRLLYKKSTNIIELYDPNPKTEKAKKLKDYFIELDVAPMMSNRKRRILHESMKRRTRNSTTDFYRVASNHHLLSNYFVLQDFKQIKLHVVGIGETTWFKYFKIIKYFNSTREPCIFYSSIKRIQKYGNGFKLFLKANIDQKPASIYVSKDQVDKYKHRRQLLDSIQKVLDTKFLDKKDIRAYFVPNEVKLRENKWHDIIIGDLSKLAITDASSKY